MCCYTLCINLTPNYLDVMTDSSYERGKVLSHFVSDAFRDYIPKVIQSQTVESSKETFSPRQERSKWSNSNVTPWQLRNVLLQDRWIPTTPQKQYFSTFRLCWNRSAALIIPTSTSPNTSPRKSTKAPQLGAMAWSRTGLKQFKTI